MPYKNLLRSYYRFVGSIISGGAVRGALGLSGNSTWLLPVWLQLLCSVIIATFILFLPESPRWLFVNGQKDKAERFMVKYHGQGRPDSGWVALQMAEYASLLNVRGSVCRLPCESNLNVIYKMAGQMLVGLSGSIPHEGLSISALLQHGGQRFWSMDG